MAILKYFTGVLVAAGLSCFSASLFADENKVSVQEITTLEKIIVVGSKIPKEAVELTQSVTVINEQDIENGAYTDITEVLRKQVGIEFKQSGGPGQYNYLKLRGLSSSNVLVVIDGVKINKPSSGDTGNLLSQLDPGIIESIEILRGPQATLYGANNSAGVISITTKSGHTPSAKIGGELGSLGWRKQTGSWRDSSDLGQGKFFYSLNASDTDSDNTHEYEYFEDTSLQAKFSFETEFLALGVNVLDVDNRFGYAELDEASSGLDSRSDHWAYQTPDPEQYSSNSEQVYSLFAKQQLTDSLSHKFQISQMKNRYSNIDPDNGLLGVHLATVDGIVPGSVVGDVLYIYDRRYPGIELAPLDLNDPANTISDTRAFHEDASDQYNYDLLYQSVGLNVIGGVEHLVRSAHQWGSFGESESEDSQTSLYLNSDINVFGDSVVLASGLRYDDYESWGEQTTGNIGVSWAITDQTTIYSNVGNSFAPATMSQLFNPTYGDSNLTPEEGNTIELGIRQSAFNNQLKVEATYWNTNIDNIIYYDYSAPNPRAAVGFGQYNNGAKSRSSGVELQASYFLARSLTLHGNYTYTDSQTKAVGGDWERTVQVARNKGNLGFTFAENALTLALHAYYSGSRLRWAGDVEMKEYVRLDLSSTYQIGDRLLFSTRVENILDEDIEEGLGYEEPGIYAIVGLDYYL